MLAAAQALADVVSVDELNPDYIIPSVFNDKVAGAVADAVRDAAKAAGAEPTDAPTHLTSAR